MFECRVFLKPCFVITRYSSARFARTGSKERIKILFVYQTITSRSLTYLAILTSSGGIQELLLGCCYLGRMPKNNRT